MCYATHVAPQRNEMTLMVRASNNRLKLSIIITLVCVNTKQQQQQPKHRCIEKDDSPFLFISAGETYTFNKV